ncbi:MAG: sulfotransferase [Verrucomicrobiota bacterium]
MAKIPSPVSAVEGKVPSFHPFAGARLGVFLRHALLTSRTDARTRFQRFSAWAIQLSRQPFAVAESIRYSSRVNQTPVEKPPIFLIGHWGSGASVLQQFMIQDPQFEYLKMSDAVMPQNMHRPSQKLTQGFWGSNVGEPGKGELTLPRRDDPAEDEIARGNLNPASYQGVYCFPRDREAQRDRALFFEGAHQGEEKQFRLRYEWLVRKVSFLSGGRQVVFRNPASTVRMGMLLEAFPDAKFVHLVRNPWEVYCSTRDHLAERFRALAWQSFDQVDSVSYTLDTYEKVMNRYLDDRKKLEMPANQLHEVRYEDLVADPIGEVAGIYDALGLESKAVGLAHLKEYLARTSKPRAESFRISTDEFALVRNRWRLFFKAWSYRLALIPSVKKFRT